MTRNRLAIFLISCVFLIGKIDCFGQTPEQRSASVCIEATLGNAFWHGSGVIVEPGYVLTAAHVVANVDRPTKTFKPIDTLKIRTIKGEVFCHDVVIYVGPDIAWLKPDSLPDGLSMLRLAKEPAKFDDEIALLTRSGMTKKKSHAHIRLQSVRNDASPQAVTSGDWAMLGDSGAPWLNEAGEIVGMIVVCYGESDGMVNNFDGEPVPRFPACGGPGLVTLRESKPEDVK